MRKVLSVILILVLLVTSFPFQPKPVEAAVVGGGGSIPGGGSTGSGGGVSLNPAYRVGLINEKMKNGNDIGADDKNSTVEGKIKTQFNNHYPRLQNSIIFAPSNVYTTDSKLAWYTPSSGEMQFFESDTELASKLRPISGGGSSNAVFFNALKARSPKDMSKLKNGGWKNVAAGSPTSASLAVWSHLLSDKDRINEKLKIYTDDDKADSKDALEAHLSRLHYLDLLMTLYNLSAGSQRSFYESEIDRYVSGADVGEKPLLIGIDTVARFSVPAQLGSTKLFIPSIEYVQWAHGGTVKSDLTNPAFSGGGSGTKDLIQASASLALKDAPSRKRITDLTGDAYRNNGFSWGYSGVVGSILRTGSGSATWSNSNTTGIMESLVFNGSMYGFIVQGASQNRPQPPDAKGTAKLFFGSPYKTGQSVKIETPKIGKTLPVKISLKQSTAVQKTWAKYLKDKTKFKATVVVKRTTPSASTTLTKAGTSPTIGTATVVSKAQLQKWLSGSEELTYNDNLTAVDIAENTKIKFTYTAKVTLVVDDTDIKKFTDAQTEDEDLKPIYINFYRGKTPNKECTVDCGGDDDTTVEPPPVEKAEYTSVPAYWSEIKEGSPENETFEAMAGTPTTRNLYFASGGSEFIVDVEVEYVKDGTATRSYRSQFTAVPSGWNMSSITGPIQKDSPPPAPTPRTKTDVSGASYTEQVVMESSPYEKKPAVGSPGQPGYVPAEMGTQYWWVQKGYYKMVGGYSDSWTQDVTFDYTKMNNVRVWKIDRSRVDGMETLVQTEEVEATITQGDPTFFGNVAASDTSQAGRLRYSLEPNQHDNVVWNEGPSDNRDANSDSDSYVNEKQKFKERREMTTNVTAVSDFLILQTDGGDQAVMYFQKEAPAKKTTEKLEVPKTSFTTMWASNSNSASRWSKDHITIGSYNGKFNTPGQKYSQKTGGTVSTVFDSLPAGMNRPARPSAATRLNKNGLDVPDKLPNGEYITGNSTIFYKLVWEAGLGDRVSPYETESDEDYSAPGQQFPTTYSDNHSKVNDVVIHDPVSNEDAMIIPLPAERDQRTTATKAIGGNLQGDTIEYEKVLKPEYQNWTPPPPKTVKQTVPNPAYMQGGGDPTMFAYTGGVQSFTAKTTGDYLLEVWGAEGSRDQALAGKGGYSKGTLKLSAGQKVDIYVGGQNGFNGGGAPYSGGTGWGGGATDIRVSSNKVIVAGGGGGGGDASPADEKGGDGGGLTGGTGTATGGGAGSVSPAPGGTQTAGGPTNLMGSAGSAGQGGAGGTFGGGGGGGYYGGSGGSNGGGGGGSGYIGKVSGGTTQSGVNSGNGKASITPPKGDPTQPEFIEIDVLDDSTGTTLPDDAYDLIPKTRSPLSPVNIPNLGSFVPGNFINLDYPFTLYFPNTGDFYGDGALGIPSTTSQRGKGFVDNMDTTQWISKKTVQFEFNVIFEGKMYTSGEEIELPVPNTTFQFYAPLANREAISSAVQFKTYAINNPYTDALDNDSTTNRLRFDGLAARHSAYKVSNIDVVGRIGNMVLEDTGDFRFSNFFKQALTPTKWLINNVVKKVNTSKQNKIIGDTVDIRGLAIGNPTRYLNTYGLLGHVQQNPVPFPLSPEKNNIEALRKQPMRVGYNVLADIQTLGNYYDNMQIIPYYYNLNLKNGEITPVDIYMDVNGYYKPINKNGIANETWDPSSIYQFVYKIDWISEAARRNFSSGEKSNTQAVIDFYKRTDDAGVVTKMAQPYGSYYNFGTAQIMHLTGRNRTFMGTEETYGDNKNPGSVLPKEFYGLQGQRWHFTYGLPSSAVVVTAGQEPTQANIKKFQNNNSVIVMAGDIKAIGDTYALQYKIPGGNQPVQLGGNNYPTTTIPYPVISVYTYYKSSADDLEVTGTH